VVFGMFRKPDPSEEWADERPGDVVLDLRNLTLNEVGFGAPAAELAPFGRPANPRPFKEEIFRYERVGVVIEAEDGKVSYFGLPVVADENAQVGPCRLILIMPCGTALPVDHTTDPMLLVTYLSQPDIMDEDANERWIEFDLGAHKLELEAAPQGGALRRVNCFPKGPPGG
jgi:hypothetical protein